MTMAVAANAQHSQAQSQAFMAMAMASMNQPQFHPVPPFLGDTDEEDECEVAIEYPGTHSKATPARRPAGVWAIEDPQPAAEDTTMPPAAEDTTMPAAPPPHLPAAFFRAATPAPSVPPVKAAAPPAKARPHIHIVPPEPVAVDEYTYTSESEEYDVLAAPSAQQPQPNPRLVARLDCCTPFDPNVLK